MRYAPRAMSPAPAKKMKKEVLKFVNLEKDSLRIYELCQSCAVRIQSFGIKAGWEINDDVCEVI
jgi:CRISPR/Cas system-associated endoribonuclease Cas2